MRAKFLFSLLSVLALTALLSDAVLAGGGGKKNKGKNDPANDMAVFYWQASLDDAEDEAETTKRPIMLVIVKSWNGDDYKPVEKLISWPYAVVGSHRDFVAARDTIATPATKALCEKMQVKALPVICWMDHYGNPVTIQTFPATAEALETVPHGWPALQTKVDKFFKDHLDRGDRYLKINQFREGYKELGVIAPFKGPLPEKARESQKKVKEQWNKLLTVAKASPPKERTVILQGIARETSGTELEREMLEAVTAAMNAAGDKPAKAIKPEPDAVATAEPAKAEPAPAPNAPEASSAPAAPTPVADASKPVPPVPVVAPAPAATAKAAEAKTLSDLASASSSMAPAPAEPDDSQIGSVLLGKNDGKLKDANTLIQAAMASYRKAIADATERGPARNEMLKTAYTRLSQALDILEASTTAKADAQLDKVEQDISMMMYGCLKYQSL